MDVDSEREQDSEAGQKRRRVTLTAEELHEKWRETFSHLEPRRERKGSAGRVAVWGGSQLYCGAPCFAALAALKLGVDLVFLKAGHSSVARAVKSRSLNIMVAEKDVGLGPEQLQGDELEQPQHGTAGSSSASHDPFASTSSSTSSTTRKRARRDDQDGDKSFASIVSSTPSYQKLDAADLEVIRKCHTLVIGPGLGRDDKTVKIVQDFLRESLTLLPGMPLILDADALFAASKDPTCLENRIKSTEVPPPQDQSDALEIYRSSQVILTPNSVEAPHLPKEWWKAPGFAVIEKGRKDCITTTRVKQEIRGWGTPEWEYQYSWKTWVSRVTSRGSVKRCGGIGDVLAGIVGGLMAWQRISGTLSTERTLRLACFIAREAAYQAEQRKKRAMLAEDVIEAIPGVCEELEPYDDKSVSGSYLSSSQEDDID
ncbi:unnamed protein product [Amoebophrya sp. A25]|nr:unnamed protein product [Amoebophrya sp. A25]|eukprot:GSA25T00022963001.1